MPNNNNWGSMKAAEWRGKFGEKLDRLEVLMAAACAKVDSHDTELAILRDRHIRARLGGRAQATIAASVIGAAAGIIIALIALLGG